MAGRLNAARWITNWFFASVSYFPINSTLERLTAWKKHPAGPKIHFRGPRNNNRNLYCIVLEFGPHEWDRIPKKKSNTGPFLQFPFPVVCGLCAVYVFPKIVFCIVDEEDGRILEQILSFLVMYNGYTEKLSPPRILQSRFKSVPIYRISFPENTIRQRHR
jgi:hypothetical protein